MTKIFFDASLMLACFCFFQHTEAAWTPPVTISAPYAILPHIGIDAAGNGVAIWEQYDGSRTVIQATTYSVKTGSWSTPQPISAPGQNAGESQVTVNSKGDAVAIWRRFDGFNTIVQAATLLSGSDTWIPASADLSPTGVDAYSPQASLSPKGDAVAIWCQFDRPFNNLRAATFSSGSTTWIPTTDVTINSQVVTPQVVVGPTGDAVAVWASIETGNLVLKAAILPVGTGIWLPAVNVTELGMDITLPQIAVNPSGKVMAVWLGSSGFKRIVQAATFSFDSGWSAPVDVSTPDLDAFNVRVAIDPFGNVVALWSTFDDDYNQIIQTSTRLSSDNHWSVPETLAMSTTALNQSLAIDGEGTVIAVWTEFDGDADLVRATIRPYGGVWSLPVVISPSGVDSDLVQIAMNPNGEAIVVWTNDCLSVIQAAILPDPPPPSPPPLPPSNFSGIIKKNKFLNKTECYLQATWEASLSADVTSYRIYKNGKQVAEISADSRLFYQTQLHKCFVKGYTVTAVNADNLESKPIPIQTR